MFWKYLALLFLWKNYRREIDRETNEAERNAARLDREEAKLLQTERREAEKAEEAARKKATAPPPVWALPLDLDRDELASLILAERNLAALDKRQPKAIAIEFESDLRNGRPYVFVVSDLESIRERIETTTRSPVEIYRSGSNRKSFRHLPLFQVDAVALGCWIVAAPGDAQL